MTPEQKTTIRSRELGDALRLAMERANLSGRHAAHVLGWSETKVSRMLTGRQPVTEADVSALLALCLVTGGEKDRLLGLAREHDQRGWLQGYGSGLPEQLRTLINHENQATVITEFEALRIPGLLQTSDYARALFERSVMVPPDKVETAIDARLRRQHIFDRHDHPRFNFFLHELTFHLPVGGPAVMSHQMHHLLQMGVRSYISIRVVPAALGAHAGMSGACRLMEYAELRPVAYVEEAAAGHFMEDPAEVDPYRTILAALANCALDETESKEVIAELAIRLYAD